MTGPNVWHPFTQLRNFQPRGTVVSAQGAWLTLSDGRRVLDGISSWWVSIHGHSHPHIVDFWRISQIFLNAELSLRNLIA